MCPEQSFEGAWNLPFAPWGSSPCLHLHWGLAELGGFRIPVSAVASLPESSCFPKIATQRERATLEFDPSDDDHGGLAQAPGPSPTSLTVPQELEVGVGTGFFLSPFPSFLFLFLSHQQL